MPRAKSVPAEAAESTVVDVLDTKTILDEKQKKQVREAGVTIDFATNNKLQISVSKDRSAKLIKDNVNGRIKVFLGTKTAAEAHCINYPNNVTLVPHETMQKALTATLKILKSDEELVKPVEKKERKSAKAEAPAPAPAPKAKKSSSKKSSKKAVAEEAAEVVEA